MIRHVVLWRFKPEAKSAGKITDLARIERNIQAMRGAIPGLLRIEIGANQAAGADVADLMLLADFVSWDALKHYEQHALHDELRGIIGPQRTERRLVDYEIKD